MLDDSCSHLAIHNFDMIFNGGDTYEHTCTPYRLLYLGPALIFQRSSRSLDSNSMNIYNMAEWRSRVG